MGNVKPDWLAQLAGAHAPPPPHWWPLAPGWWLLGALCLVSTLGIWWWQRRPHFRLRRAALRELAQLASSAEDDPDFARALEHLLRRYALARFGREAVAGLSGVRWVDFVVAHGGSDWSGTAGMTLLQAAYGGTPEPQRARWISGARGFLKARK